MRQPFRRGQIDVVVPVRDAEARINWLVDLYSDLGLEPLFIVDQRTRDSSAALLSARGARVQFAQSDYPRVESLLFHALPTIETEWVLRFDDDEAPSQALVEWVSSHLRQPRGCAVGLARRWVGLDAAKALHGSSCTRVDGQPFPDWQFRLFRPAAVSLTTDIHTPGFVLEQRLFAPESACFFHFDWVVRTYAERRAKMEKYEAQSPGAGRNFAHFYLPEDHEPLFYAGTPVNDSKIQDLAHRLESHSRKDQTMPEAWRPRLGVWDIS